MTSEMKFQIIDFYSEDTIVDNEFTSSSSDTDTETDSDSESDIEKYHKKEKINLEYKIILFGKDLDEKTYSLQINGFQPYYYLRMPDTFTKRKIPIFKNWIEEKLKEYKTDLVDIEYEQKFKFRNFNNHTKYKYVKLSFINVPTMKKSMSLFQDKTWDDIERKYIDIRPKKLTIPGVSTTGHIYELSDNMIDPMIRFIHHAKITPVGWISVNNYQKRTNNLTHCNYNLETHWKNVLPYECDEIAKFKIMSYDIECDSSHGDFPLAIKDYLKLSREIVNEYERMIKMIEQKNFNYNLNQYTEFINDIDKYLRYCFEIAFGKGNEYISKVYTKKRAKPSTHVINTVISKIPDFMKDFSTSLKVKEKNQIKNDNIQKLNNLLYNIEYPDNSLFPALYGDKTIQIGCSFIKYGETKEYRNVMLTLKSCDPIVNTEVYCFDTEKELLMKFNELIISEDPEIITGYNTEGFDTPWLMKRAKELFNKQNCEKFLQLSRFKENRVDQHGRKYYCELREKQEKSGVGELIKVEFIEFPGRVQLDILKLVQKGYNLSSYKLDDVSAEFIQGSIKQYTYDKEQNQTIIETDNVKGLNKGNFIIFIEKDGYLENKYLNGKKFEIIDIQGKNLYIHDNINLQLDKFKCSWCLGKDDVSPQDIFRLQKGNSHDRYIIAKYCMMDVILCNELLLKLELLTNSLGISKVCLIPLDWTLHRGQGVRLISLITEELKQENYVLPFLYKNLNDSDSYEGAIVLKPYPGIYINDPVAVLDYASLYPNSIRMGNLSHETICKDEKWLGEDGANLLKKLGYDYLDVSYDLYDVEKSESGAVKKKTKSGVETIRYVQYPNGEKGIVPNVIEKLLVARKSTRNKITFQTVILESGESFSGNLIDIDEHTIKIIDEYKKPVITIEKTQILEKKDTFNDFQKKVLDGLQLGFKVTANSLYGQIGAKVSHLYYKEIAASTTAIGREQLEIAQNFCENPENFVKTLDDGTIIKLQNKVVYGDTDSVFVKYQCIDGKGNRLLGREARGETIRLAIECEKGIKKLLKSPQDLEYEKTFDPFILFTKKRYVGNKYEHDLDKYKQTSMGIVTKRRDNAPIVKVIFGGIIDSIMKEHRIEPSIEFLKTSIDKLISGHYGLDALVISKTLSSYYKDPDKIAHKVLANRIADRDPGNKPQVNDRIPFVYINTDDKSKNILQGDRIETPQFIKENKLMPNYQFYITNQIQKPVCQIYGLCVEQIPGYKNNTNFDLIYNTCKKAGKSEIDSIKKVMESKQRIAYELLFNPYIRKLENKKNGNIEITKWFSTKPRNTKNNDPIIIESSSESDEE